MSPAGANAAAGHQEDAAWAAAARAGLATEDAYRRERLSAGLLDRTALRIVATRRRRRRLRVPASTRRLRAA
mgnify:CR=1 FL=1